MSEYKYWRVVCKYGHVGKRNEVSVPRYLRTDSNCRLTDVLEMVSRMPGVKKSNNILYGIANAKAINQQEYEDGKEMESENLFLQQLMSFNERPVANSA